MAHLLEILAARDVLYGLEDIPPIYHNAGHYFSSIDAIRRGGVKWKSIAMRYSGPVDRNSPSWMRTTYVVHLRDTLEVAAMMAANPDFDGAFDMVPYEETITLPSGARVRRVCNLMSGQWASHKAVSHDLVPKYLCADSIHAIRTRLPKTRRRMDLCSCPSCSGLTRRLSRWPPGIKTSIPCI